MKMMHGACALPCSNRSRTRDAPTPTNISTKSEPDIEKNGRAASPATALASSVFPAPGGPTRRPPRGQPPAGRVERLRFRDELHDLSAEVLRFAAARHIGEGDLRRVS